MTTIYNTDVFRLSLKSLVETAGDHTLLVVEDGLHPEDVCADYTGSMGVTYIKDSQHRRLTEMIHNAISQYDLEEYDYLVVVHNDIYFPHTWVKDLERTIERLKRRNIVNQCPLLNAEYYEVVIKNQPVPIDISFRDATHAWLDSMIYHTNVSCYSNYKLGIGNDRWNIARAGRVSPIFAVNMDFLLFRGGFCIDEIEYDLSMLEECSRDRKWNIWYKQRWVPLHFRPTESGNDTVLKFQHGVGHTHYEFMAEVEKNFVDHYGFPIELWFDIEFGAIKQKYRKEIENELNAKTPDLSRLEYVFNEIWNDNRLCVPP